jgi:hypothetical protein
MGLIRTRGFSVKKLWAFIKRFDKVNSYRQNHEIPSEKTIIFLPISEKMLFTNGHIMIK